MVRLCEHSVCSLEVVNTYSAGLHIRDVSWCWVAFIWRAVARRRLLDLQRDDVLSGFGFLMTNVWSWVNICSCGAVAAGQ